MSSFIKTENFKSRFFSSIILLLISLVALFTPNMVAFRVLFLATGTMAIIEFSIATRERFRMGVLTDDRLVILEIAIIVIGTGSLVLYLSPDEIILTIISAIANDTMAYVFGNLLHNRFFKTRPFPKTSPKKSWEGIIGGYMSSILITQIALILIKQHAGFTFGNIPFSNSELVFVFLAPLFAILGDWCESASKRILDLKDSGERIIERKIPVLSQLELLMKGHGGFADRIDSWVLVSSFMLWLKLF